VETLQLGEDATAVQVVMDHSGDTRHWYDADNERSLLEAKERFRQLCSFNHLEKSAVISLSPWPP
jgi:hypothetical protein